MASIFTKIVNGEIPCYKVAEDEKYLAFLDINPNAKGHTLCIPKVEIDKILDLDEATFLGLMAFSKKVGKAIEATVSCNRVGISVIGLEVPHAHVHLIPLNSMQDASFLNKVSMTTEEFTKLAKEIGSKIQ